MSLDFDYLRESSSRLEPIWLVGSLVAVLMALVVSSYRWKVLLDVHGVHPPFIQLLRFYAHGQFFLMIVPSFIGADAIRVWGMRGESGQTSLGIASVLIERLAGLHAVATMSLIGLLMTNLGAEYPSLLLLTILLFTGVSLALAMVIYSQRFAFVLDRVPFPAIKSRLIRLQETASSYQNHRGVLLKVWLLSLSIQLLVVVVMFCGVRVVGYDLPFFKLSAITALIVFVSAIPLSPAALGLQEGAYIVLLGRMGIPAEDALLVSLLARTVNIVVALIGGLDLALAGFVGGSKQHANSTD